MLASTWRQGGFDAHEAVLPAVQAANNQIHGTYRDLHRESWVL